MPEPPPNEHRPPPRDTESTQDAAPAALDLKLVEVLDKYTEDLRAGVAPSRAELLAAHPELGEQLEQCLAGIEFIQTASRSPTPPQLGDFRIVREIGRGGMGVVYEAEQISLSRRVALKVLRHAVADQEAMERFQREAETVARLHHTNIVPIHAVGSEGGVHFYAMQFIEGRSLADVERDAEGLLDADDVARWGLEAAEALAHAHQRGVIHRDVKPSNLLRDEEGRIWLTDFGLAKRLDDVRLSMTGAILGTPRYMSPEQASAMRQPVDHRTDIYSLGATLYELATGRPAFDAETPHAVIGQILGHEPAPPRKVRPGLSRDLETIIVKCLAKNARERYASTQQLADDLRALLDGRAIKARRPSAVETARRWAIKHRRSVKVAASAAAVAAILIAGAVVGNSAYHQSRIGQIKFDTDQPPLVAELRDDQGRLAAEPFTVPTQQAVSLPDGQYNVRVSAPGRLGDTFKVSVDRGASDTLNLNLQERALWPDLDVSGAFELVQTKGGCDVVLFDDRGITRLDGRTRQQQWFLSLAGEEGGPPAIAEAPRFHWHWRDDYAPSGFGNLARHPIVLQPAVDLDGDGSEDFVFGCQHQAALLAVSGDSGGVLWAFVGGAPSKAAQRAGWRSEPHGKIVGAPAAASDLDGDGIVDLFATVASIDRFRGGGQVEQSAVAISGRSGDLLWQFDLPAPWFKPPAGKTAPAATHWPYEMHMARSHPSDTLSPRGSGLVRSGITRFQSSAPMTAYPVQVVNDDARQLAVVVAGTRLVCLDATTGEPHTPTRNLGYIPIRPPIVAELANGGLPEVLLCEQQLNAADFSNPGALRLTAWSLQQQQPLWSHKTQADWQWQLANHTPIPSWPLVADLDADGASEIIIADGNTIAAGSVRSSAAGRLQVLDGANGQPQWPPSTRRPSIRNVDQQLDRFLAGPDVNGDKVRDVFVVSLCAVNRSREMALFVDALSGADGERIWWSHRPLDAPPRQAELRVGDAFWWGAGPDGAPQLVVSTVASTTADERGDVVMFSAATGRITSEIPGREFIRKADGDGDGVDDLFCFQPGEVRRFEQGGKLSAWRGEAPAHWKRIGDQAQVAGDLDGDGARDFICQGAFEGLRAVSGSDGRQLWINRTSTGGTAFAAPLQGDFDGDGAPDVFFTPWGVSHRPPRLLSGRTGRTLWRMDFAAHYFGEPLLAEALDVSGDGRPELLIAANTDFGLPPSGLPGMVSPSNQAWRLFCISGSSGRVLWSQQLSPSNSRVQTGWEGLPFAVADVDGDNLNDLIVPALAGPNQLQWRAIRGTDGRVLWKDNHPPSRNTISVSDIPVPAIGDFDDDGSLEAAWLQVPTRRTNQDKWPTDVVVLDAANGEVKWTWRTDRQYLPASRGRGEHGMWGRPVVLSVNLGPRKQRIGLWLVNAQNQTEFVLIERDGEGGKTAKRIPLSKTSSQHGTVVLRQNLRVFNVDVNDDGVDELIYCDGRDLCARSIADDEPLWRWPLPHPQAALLGITRADDGRRLIYVCCSQPAGEEEVYAIDAARGAAQWKCKSPAPASAWPPMQRIYVVEPAGKTQNAAVAFALQDGPVAGMRAETLSDDAAPFVSVAAHAPPDRIDPRRIRSLPWAGPERPHRVRWFFDSLLAPIMLSVLLVYGPAVYLHRLLRGGRFSLRWLLLAPVVIAASVLALQMPVSDAPAQWSLTGYKYFLALMIVPVVYFLVETGKNVYAARWRRLLLWAGVVIVFGVLFGALAIGGDGGLQNGDRYNWDGWYMMLLMGVTPAAVIMILAAGVRSFWRRLTQRRLTQRGKRRKAE